MTESKTSRNVLLLAAFALVGLLVVGAGGALAARGGFLGGHFGHGGGCHIDRIAEELQLTPEQRAPLDRIRNRLHGRLSERIADRGQHFDEIIARLEAGPVDPAEVRAAIDERIEEHRQLAYEVADDLTAFANGLDDEQRQEVIDHLEQLNDWLESFPVRGPFADLPDHG